MKLACPLEVQKYRRSFGKELRNFGGSQFTLSVDQGAEKGKALLSRESTVYVHTHTQSAQATAETRAISGWGRLANGTGHIYQCLAGICSLEFQASGDLVFHSFIY